MSLDEGKAKANSIDHDHDAPASETHHWGSNDLLTKLTALSNIEIRGIQPVPVEERTNRRAYNIFTLWFTLSTNPLPYVCCLTELTLRHCR